MRDYKALRPGVVDAGAHDFVAAVDARETTPATVSATSAEIAVAMGDNCLARTKMPIAKTNHPKPRRSAFTETCLERRTPANVPKIAAHITGASTERLVEEWAICPTNPAND
jgi:hypothetical protein